MTDPKQLTIHDAMAANGSTQYQPAPAAKESGAPAPLTDEALLEILKSIDPLTHRLPPGMKLFARAVEAARDAQFQAHIDALTVERDVLRNDLTTAISMLAGWCVAVEDGGAGWDYWDDHYKDAAFRDGPLRAMLDQAIAKERAP